MSWKKVAWYDEVATLSDTNPQDVIAQSASAGSGTQAARDDHLHNLGTHAAVHQNGGADEISVAGLDGQLAAAQLALPHAASHKLGGTDVIKLNEFGLADGTINVNDQMITKMRFEAASAAVTGSPADGSVFFDTDDDHVYVYVA